MKLDVAIIGAGLSGLTAGIRLAHFDYKVCVFERHTRVGGLNSYYSRKGRHIDVGLHAMTNFAPPGVKTTPWPRLLRQLRFAADEIPLCQQTVSDVRFPGRRLAFTNEFAHFESEIAREFPSQIDGFRQLLEDIETTDAYSLEPDDTMARAVVSSRLSDPVLVDMLFCPIMFYGSATERDMSWRQFVIMFNSLFREGLSRPEGGVRGVLDRLVDRYQELGGELRMRCGVQEIETRDGALDGLILDNGDRIEADVVLSSAGYPETMSMCGAPDPATDEIGRLGFVESIFVLDAEPRDLGVDTCITFFSDNDAFAYQRPDELIDPSSGVICTPNNFDFGTPMADGELRVTHLANYDRWKALDPSGYAAAKNDTLAASLVTTEHVASGVGERIVDQDCFTPLTVERFTSRMGGAIYGATTKRLTGETGVENVFLCGADQGYLGIVGAMHSGVTMANNHVVYRSK